IVYNTQSLFLIDDSAENAYDTATAPFPHPHPHPNPTKVLLFGTYPWNAIVHTPETTLPVEKLTFVAKQERGLLEEAERVRRGKIGEGWLPEGVERVAGWGEVVRWVEGMEW
ncbi:hypothetical protein B9479_005945, partial [Cryptococcus floricola]